MESHARDVPAHNLCFRRRPELYPGSNQQPIGRRSNPPRSQLWRVENGELIGKATGNGSWLVLDRSYQDTGFYAAFRCTGVCDTGILLRMTKTVAGINGTYLSIRGTEITGENLTLDPQGNIVDREKLENAAGMIRYAPPRLDPTVLPHLPRLPSQGPMSGYETESGMR
jgi:hypothetical protein